MGPLRAGTYILGQKGEIYKYLYSVHSPHWFSPRVTKMVQAAIRIGFDTG